jgi:hypothetical protein
MAWFKRTFFDLFKPLINSYLKQKWNNNWITAYVYYEVDSENKTKKDVRKTFKCVSNTIEQKLKKVVIELIKDCKNDDERAFAIFNYVKKNIRYVRDIQNYYKNDFWASPDETFQRSTGDCEDGAILINKMMELASIPMFRHKIVIGNTIYGYHAYAIYLKELVNEWFCLDWCLCSELSILAWEHDIKHEINNVYLSIDCTFNEDLCWAQRDLLLKPNFEVREETK